MCQEETFGPLLDGLTSARVTSDKYASFRPSELGIRRAGRGKFLMMKRREFIARRDGDRVRVFSRHGKDWTDKVPAIVEAMLALPVKSATFDGEGVVVDDLGVTDFERLRTALAERNGSRSAFLYAFDLLELDGLDLRARPWETRRETLTWLLRRAGARIRKAGSGIRLSEHLDGEAAGEIIFRQACAMGLEGIVAKRRDRPYRSGRCADWVKVKNPDAPAATRVIEG
jgi:bifunctional non-homologous end joining protein LigD